MIAATHTNTQRAGSCVMVIFGASGDLTKRKLIPALCNLAQADLIPHEFAVVGFSYSVVARMVHASERSIART